MLASSSSAPRAGGGGPPSRHPRPATEGGQLVERGQLGSETELVRFDGCELAASDVLATSFSLTSASSRRDWVRGDVL